MATTSSTTPPAPTTPTTSAAATTPAPAATQTTPSTQAVPPDLILPRIIVVTGASGFTGPFVVRDLARRFPAATLRCLVRPTSDRAPLADIAGVEFAVGDLRDRDSLARAFDGADTLVNVASLGFDWVERLFEAVRGSSLRRGVFVSTTAILTALPVQSKPLRERGEALARESGLAWTILRPTMIYGTPGDRNISRLIQFVRRWPVVPVMAGEALQQPIHVEDVASAVGAAVAHPITIGRTYNISGREPLTLTAMVQHTARALGRRRVVLPLPFTPVLWGAKAYALVSSRPRIKVEQVQRLREDKAFPYDAARTDFGFAPRSFAAGVEAEVQLMR